MSESPPITNYEIYNGKMQLSMLDKLFFLDKINPDLIVDFGCADGSLLNEIDKIKHISLAGYDIDPKMARNNCNFPIYSKWDNVQGLLKDYKQSALILSSVIHEVLHYGSKSDIDIFWSRVFNEGFKYIIIRDMIPSRGIDRISNINDVKKVYNKFLGGNLLNDFERRWGSIEYNRQLIHFLLKYKYSEPNWEREVRENYIPISREELLSKIPDYYDIIFHEHYVLPYLYQTVKKEIGIEIKDPTHLKLILVRNES